MSSLEAGGHIIRPHVHRSIHTDIQAGNQPIVWLTSKKIDRVIDRFLVD